MPKIPKILVIGSFMMDLIASAPRVPNMGETVIGTSFCTAPGGKGANQAAQCAKLGAHVVMAGCVGNDAFGREMVNAVRMAGVDASRVKISADHASGTGNIQLEVTESGVQNRILVVPGANYDLTVADLDWLKDSVGDYDLMMLQLELPMEVVRFSARCAYEAGVPVMLNPAPAAELDEELLSFVTYLSPNEHEAALLSGVPLRMTQGGADESSLRAVAEALRGKGANKIIITLGENGSVLYDGKNMIRAECVKAADVKDPTAAGDSFVAAFCVGITAGLSEQEALVFASGTAAITVSGMGAMPSLPDAGQVRALMTHINCPKGVLEMLNVLGRRGAGNMKKESRLAVDEFLASARLEFDSFADRLNSGTYLKATELILDSRKNGGRLHITGVGKPGHVSEYMASLFSSTGTPCYFLHGTEAVHGSCGQLAAEDVVISISNSGETAELKSTVTAVKNIGCKIIGVTGDMDSWLARESDVCLYAGVRNEGGPLNRAPRNSIMAEMLTLQALSVALQAEVGWSPSQYVRCHPGGKLGELRENER